jgi:hypothetical protein
MDVSPHHGENIARIEVRSIYSPGTDALPGTAPPNDWSAR